MHRVVVGLIGVFALCGAAAQAQMPGGSAERGARLAQAWCAGCHVVGARGADAAPPLSEIAKQPELSTDWLILWLADPHPAMPQLQLSRQEIADIMAHMERLTE